MKFYQRGLAGGGPASPPSRGAWIEMPQHSPSPTETPSPPSRGAWIEIPYKALVDGCAGVAPLAGGVD